MSFENKLNLEIGAVLNTKSAEKTLKDLDAKVIKTKDYKINVKVVSRKISGRVFIDVSDDGVKDGNEIYVENVAATLYSLDNDNALTAFL